MAAFKPRATNRARDLRNSATDAERRLWTHLSRRQLGGAKFSRQMPIGPYFCDFLCREARLVIEVDGGQHADRVDADDARTHFLELQGFRVLRFWNNEVLENIEGVLITIEQALGIAPPPAPHASGRGAGA